ncbi:MAG: hypothetical protein FJX59_16820 [Alphaproteobacteria bacterium]|nr:hypothetical protein [Alphaproteobacteria bacterium]
MEDFSEKDRRRLRQFLELAHSTAFDGEREAAMSAATRLAELHGMTLREAVGMSEADERAATASAHKPHAHQPPPHRSSSARDPFGQFEQKFGFGRKHPNAENIHQFRTETERVAHEKRMRDAALAEAFRRGLDAEELRRKRKADWLHARRSSNRWRPRSEFIRVLLRETQMTAREIALTAGVSVYDVFREKLLMRRAAA